MDTPPTSSQPPPPPPPPFSSAATPVTPARSDLRTWTVLCHASALAGLVFHFLGHLGGPLIVWLWKRHESAEIDAHGKESLNFQLTWLIYDAIALFFALSSSAFRCSSCSGF